MNESAIELNLAGAVPVTEAPTSARWKLAAIAFGLLMSGVFLWLTLRSVNAPQLWDMVCAADPLVLSLALSIGMASTIVRAFRWGAIIGDNPPVGLRTLYTSMMIGYLANNVLPARMGELVRVYVLRRKTGASMSTAAATVVFERVSDALFLLVLMAALTVVVPLPDALRDAGGVATVLFGAGALFLLLFAFHGDRLARSAGQLAGVASARLGTWTAGIVERFVVGFRVLRSPRQGLTVGLVTLSVWGMDAASVWLVMRALHLDVPFVASLFVMGVVSLSFLLPAAPGAVGTYEFFAVLALSPFRVPVEQAVGLALVLHAVGYLIATVLGVTALWTEGLSLRDLAGKQLH